MAMYQTIDAYTGTHLKDHDLTSEEEVDQALSQAYAKFQSRLSQEDRRQVLVRLARILDSRLAELAGLVTMEMGKPITQSEAEIKKCALVCEHYAQSLTDYLQPEVISTEAKRSMVLLEPQGPILAIMPWNFPFWQVFRCLAPAIAIGNPVVLKHAPNVPGCALYIEEIVKQAFEEEGRLVNLFITNEVVAEVIADNRIKGVTLTGSEIAGKAVAKIAGENLKPSVFELGGSDPFVILQDADLDKAVEVGFSSRFLNAGQSCIAAKRFIVHSSLKEEFELKMIQKMSTTVLGDPTQRSTTMGPVAREDLAVKIRGQIQHLLDNGAEEVFSLPSKNESETLVSPVLINASACSHVPAHEEIFGPVACVVYKDSVEDIVVEANSTPYGLGVSLWTQDSQLMEKLIPKFESGSLFVNEMVKSDPRLPFGGVGLSGYGRELGRAGLEAFANRKTVYIN